MDFIVQNKKKVKNEIELGVLEKRIYARGYELSIKMEITELLNYRSLKNVN